MEVHDLWRRDLDNSDPKCSCDWTNYGTSDGWYRTRRDRDCTVHKGY